MKKTMFLSAIIFFTSGIAICQNIDKLPVITAAGKTASYRVGNSWHNGTWTISPHIQRDSLEVKCYGPEEIFAFKTDRDSIAFSIKPGETKSFFVNLNDTARALTVVYAVPMFESLHFANKGDEDSVRFWYGYEPGGYMARLKTAYPTEATIASAKDELGVIARLLEWTHNQWKHNGNFSPKKSDAISILDEAKAGGQFPCFAFAIVLSAKLNEAGFKSRVLYLKAKTVETDRRAPGHVVTETYVPGLKKWIFLDPQFNAMPMLNGVPLNGVEFQQAISHNTDAVTFYNNVNYNGTPYANRDYFDFVYPTLYFFDFRFDSRVDTGERDAEKIKGKYNLMLVPVGGTNPVKFGSFNGKIDYCVYTHNAKLFYQKP